MIKIHRAPSPAVLARKTKKSDLYHHEAVIKTLWEMQHQKCCYCERLLPLKGRGKEVEHFRPKSRYPELRNTWENLLLACPICNDKKADHFPVFIAPDQVAYEASVSGEAAMIDPSKVDPEEHLDYYFDAHDQDAVLNAQIGAKTRIGRETIGVLGLDSAHHYQVRRDHVHFVLFVHYRNLLEAYVERNSFKLTRSKTEFSILMSEGGHLTALSRAFARFHKLDQAPFHLEIPGPAGDPQGA